MRENLEDDGYTPDMPPTSCAEHLLGYLWEIGPTMPAGMGTGPITHEEIRAWQALTSIDLSPWEARTLRRLSGEYASWSSKAAQRDCKAPWQPENQTPDKRITAKSMRNAVKKLAQL